MRKEHKIKKDSGADALTERIRRNEQIRIIQAFGTFEFDPGYDYKKERPDRQRKAAHPEDAENNP
jgi:hypothetical protein